MRIRLLARKLVEIDNVGLQMVSVLRLVVPGRLLPDARRLAGNVQFQFFVMLRRANSGRTPVHCIDNKLGVTRQFTLPQ
jgi:hypothetical protein